MHQSEALKAALAAKQLADAAKSAQTRTLSVKSELALGDAFFEKNKNVKVAAELIEHDNQKEKRVREDRAQQAAAYGRTL
jgi:hypothetical protein